MKKAYEAGNGFCGAAGDSLMFPRYADNGTG